MAENIDYDFIEKPSEDFYCPLTHDLLKDPQLTQCCGHHLSLEAAKSLRQDGKPCPKCKQPLQFVEDKFFNRKIKGFHVRCPNKNLGCEWEGQLGDLEQHRKKGLIIGDCKYVKVSCPLKCGKDFQRCRIATHKSNCVKRPFICQHCAHKDTFELVIKKHYPMCIKFPLLCPNKCTEDKFERQHLQKHLNEECPLQVINCEFAYAGCEAKLQRRLMPAHTKETMEKHLHLLAQTNRTQQETISTLLTQNEALISHIHMLTKCMKVSKYENTLKPVFFRPPVFSMTNFEQHKKDGDCWYSPSFYSHIGGYKMCLCANANGRDDGAGTHLGIYVCMMRGEYDDILGWPYTPELIKVQLIDQQGFDHLERELVGHQSYSANSDDYKETFTRVYEGETGKCGWGFDKVISHTKLCTATHKNLKDDCLKFQVTQAKIGTKTVQ